MDLKNPTPTLPIDQGSKTRFLDLAGVSRKKKPIFSKIIKKNSEVQQILRPYETSPKKLQNHKFSSNGIEPFILIGSSKSNARLSLLF